MPLISIFWVSFQYIHSPNKKGLMMELLLVDMDIYYSKMHFKVVRYQMSHCYLCSKSKTNMKKWYFDHFTANSYLSFNEKDPVPPLPSAHSTFSSYLFLPPSASSCLLLATPSLFYYFLQPLPPTPRSPHLLPKGLRVLMSSIELHRITFQNIS